MAGVTDVVFRTLCKELGADVMVTEFVSSDGILKRDDRTRRYVEFDDAQRPVGVQLFGSNPETMAEAAKKVIDWKKPDFIDINFGCPVNKVVSKNGGSSLLKDCPTLAAVAGSIANAVPIPVTAKIRTGWDEKSINAVTVCKTLQDVGMQAIAIHGRTRSQGYSGEANWDVIGECAESVSVPVIGNGDLASGTHVLHRRESTKVSGVMIGRAAMTHPWVFKEAKHYLATGDTLPPVSLAERWTFILRHARMAIASNRYGSEEYTMQAMRSRLMAYSKGLPSGKRLRSQFAKVTTAMELEEIGDQYMAHQAREQEAA